MGAEIDSAPRANPWARPVAVVIGLTLLALALVCGREIWLRNSRSIDWDTWVNPLIMTIGDATYQPWMLPAGMVAVAAGLFLVWVAFRPRTRTHLPAGAMWMRPVDVARMLSAAARTVPGVSTAASRVSGGTAHVAVTGYSDGLAPLVDATLTDLLTSLNVDLTLRVRQRPLQEVER